MKYIILIIFFILSVFCIAEPVVLTVQEATQRAVLYSYDIQAGYRDAAITMKALGLDIRQFFPEINFSFNNNEKIETADIDAKVMTLHINLSQPLWDGGRTMLAMLRKQREIEQLLDELAEKTLHVKENVIKLYYDILITKKVLLVKQEAVAVGEEQLKLLEAELKAGVAKEIDYKKAQLQVSSLKIDAEKTELELRVKYSKLARLINVHNDFVIQDIITNAVKGLSVKENYLLAQALVRSPKLRYLAKQQDLLMREIMLSRFSFLPSVALVASFETSTDTLPFSEYSWSIGLSFSFSGSIFKGNTSVFYGRNSSNTAEIISQRSDALPLSNMEEFLQHELYEQKLARIVFDIEQEKRSLKEKFEDLLFLYTAAKQELAIAEKDYDLALKNLELTQEMKRIGTATRLDVMTATLDVSQKHIAVIQQRGQLITAERSLESAAYLDPWTLRNLFKEDE
ncbi:MAG TPA: TolC family protein [Spirochaetales bacterium]|nr:TolC family protein [Spirochaetales bacterium]